MMLGLRGEVAAGGEGLDRRGTRLIGEQAREPQHAEAGARPGEKFAA